MATSTIKDYWPILQHYRYSYSNPTDVTVTNGSKTLQRGQLQKTLNNTTLQIDFMCVGYVDGLSGGYYFFIDDVDVANAVTVFTNTASVIVGSFFVSNISAGNHSYKIRAITQGNNSFIIPAWSESIITVSELF